MSKKLEQLVIRVLGVDSPNLPTVAPPIPIEDLGLVMLDHPQITITQGLLAALLENNVAVVTCDAKHLPVGMLLPMEGHYTQAESMRAQIAASEPLKKQIWQQIVIGKIKNQAALLERLDRPFASMLTYAKNVKSGDPDNYEARAAIYYRANLWPREMNFRRNPDGDAPNHLLNYGYAILRAIVARSLVGAGLLPSLGIHHSNKYNDLDLQLPLG